MKMSNSTDYGVNSEIFGTVTNDGIKKLGSKLVEKIWSSKRVSKEMKPIRKYLHSIAKTKTEALELGNNSALTTTMVAGFVEADFKPKLLATGVIRSLPFELRGHTALKIPKGVNLTASSITNGAVSADDQDYGSITITPAWYGLRTTIDHEVLQQGLIDVVKDKLGEMGDAIGKTADSLIVTAIEAASHKNDSTYDAAGTNGNYVFSGSTAVLSYSNIISAIGKIITQNAEADAILLNGTNYGVFLNDPQIKAMIKMTSEPAGTLFRKVIELLEMKVIYSSQITANRTFLVDSKKLGYFLDASPVMTFDGRLQNTLNFEVLAAKCFGVGIIRPKAIVSIADNTADPGAATY